MTNEVTVEMIINIKNMDNSYTVIRRFTPPTCTLEIWNKNSPLSRWKKQTAVRDIRFKLSFDDPKNLDAEPVRVSGDRDRLNRFYDFILKYTDDFLARSFSDLSETETVRDRVTALASDNKNQIGNTPESFLSSHLVQHQFDLGDLLTAEKPTTITLSATQLFDLVSALEEYKSEMTALVTRETKQTKKARNLITLGLSCAGIALAVGLTAIGLQVANRSRESESVVTTPESSVEKAPPASKQETPTPDVIAPEVPEVAEQPTIPENEPLSSASKLPPPPAVDTPKPPPDIPDPAKYPPPGNLTIPPLSSVPLEKTIPSASDNPAAADDSQVESTIAVAPESTDSPEEGDIEATTNTASENTTDTSTPSLTEDNNSQSSETEAQTEIVIGRENSIDTEESESKAPASVPTIEEGIFTQNEIEELRQGDRDLENTNPDNNQLALENAAPKPTTEELDTELDASEERPESKIPQTPQLAEATSYFRQKWQSPPELKQTLEYRLIIARDGSIMRIVPIGKASEIYLDRSNIPLMGEPFVTALEDSQSLTIRLLLSPDGEVRTFLE